MRPPRCRETASHQKQRSAARGFTLLELMVVIVVVGVLVSIFTLSVGSVSEDATVEHTRRLEALLSIALEEAGIQGREYGLHFYQSGYEFSVRQSYKDKNGQTIWAWVPLDNDRLLKPRDFGEDIRVDLEIEGKKIVLEFERDEDSFKLDPGEDDEDADEDVKASYRPQVFLLSSGDIDPPFQVLIRGAFANKGINLSVSEDGVIEVVADEF